MNYVFKFKRRGFFKFAQKVNAMGHSYEPETDRMNIFLENHKGIKSVGNWSGCDLSLGSDFMLHQKQTMEKESSQDIKLG